jgi:NAD(P)-dependent dehydrogenase (short-subunit alcohol dehydrogenase family)
MEIDPGRIRQDDPGEHPGPVFWCQAAWKHALRENPGVIINIASVGGLKASPLLGTYNLTKAALIHLTRQLAAELQPTRVLGIAPGLVNTDSPSTSSTTSASAWRPACRRGAWASPTTSALWPCSSPATSVVDHGRDLCGRRRRGRARRQLITPYLAERRARQVVHQHQLPRRAPRR